MHPPLLPQCQNADAPVFMPSLCIAAIQTACVEIPVLSQPTLVNQRTALIDGRGIIAIALGSKCAFKRADLLRPLRGLDNHIHLTHRHKLAPQQDHQPSSRKNNSPEIQQTHDAGEILSYTLLMDMVWLNGRDPCMSPPIVFRHDSI